GWAGIARQLGQAGVITLGFQFSTDRGVFLHRFRLALVALFPGFLRHKNFLNYYRSAKGRPIIFKSSNASASVGAVVTIVMSIPCVRLILSSSISGKIV